MTPFLTMPTVQPQTPVQTSAVAGVPTQISTIKLPVDAVPATVNTEAVYNNTKGSGAAVTSPSMGAASTLSGNTILQGSLLGLDFRPSVQFSSPFLTQLFAQTPGSQISALTGFFANDNMPKGIADPMLMNLYSQVKYMPSNAAVPRPELANVFSLMQGQQSKIMQQLAEQKAQLMQSQIRSEPVDGGRQSLAQSLVSATTPSRPAQPATAQQSQSRNTTSPMESRSFRSLVQPTGVDAYMASFSRNIVNLTQQPESIRVAL